MGCRSSWSLHAIDGSGLGCRVCGLARAWGLGVRVWGLGLGVEGQFPIPAVGGIKALHSQHMPQHPFLRSPTGSDFEIRLQFCSVLNSLATRKRVAVCMVGLPTPNKFWLSWQANKVWEAICRKGLKDC